MSYFPYLQDLLNYIEGRTKVETIYRFFFRKTLTTDYLVTQIPFTGSAEEWKVYCGKIVKLWGRGLRSIYLRRVDMEFEVEEAGREGRDEDVASGRKRKLLIHGNNNIILHL